MRIRDLQAQYEFIKDLRSRGFLIATETVEFGPFWRLLVGDAADVVIRRARLRDFDSRACPFGPTRLDVERLARWDTVEELTLFGQYADDYALEIVSGLQTLQILYLEHASVSDRGLQQLRALSQLRHLYIGAPPIRQATHCHTLRRRLAITDDGLAAIGEIQSLAHLTIVSAPISDRGFKSLCALPALIQLALVDTDITDEAIADLRSAPVLRELIIRDCPHVTATGLKSLCQFNSLEHVELEGLNVDVDTVHELRNCLKQIDDSSRICVDVVNQHDDRVRKEIANQ